MTDNSWGVVRYPREEGTGVGVRVGVRVGIRVTVGICVRVGICVTIDMYTGVSVAFDLRWTREQLETHTILIDITLKKKDRLLCLAICAYALCPAIFSTDPPCVRCVFQHIRHTPFRLTKCLLIRFLKAFFVTIGNRDSNLPSDICDSALG